MVQSAMLMRGKSVSVGSENGMLRTITGYINHNMRVIPIRCDMKISLLACYNKKITHEKRKLLDLLLPLFV